MNADIMEHNPSTLAFLLWKAGKALTRRKDKATAQARARTRIQSLVRLVLQLAGFGLLTTAGFTWHIIAGYVIAGLSCFLLSWLTASEEPSRIDNGPDSHFQR